MKGLNIPVEEFLKPFFNVVETVCIKVFSDRKGSSFRGQKIGIDMGKIEKIPPLLLEYNNKDIGIFFVMNYGGYENKDITRVNAQFVENDNLPLEEQYKMILPPAA